MRKYENQKERQVQEILCNCCGRKIRIEKGMVMEGVFHGQVQWGYFSKKTERAIALTSVRLVMTG